MKVALQASPYNRLDLYEAAGFEVVQAICRTEDELIELLKDADGAQVGILPLTSKRVLEQCPKLKVVSRMGVGVDSIDLDAATRLGILACNVPGSNTAEVADHAMAMLLALTRRLHDAIRTTREGAWSKDRRITLEYYGTVRRIAGHTVGIVGFGNIGRAFALRIRGFGPARILACDPYVSQGTADLYGVRIAPLEEVLAESDYVTIHCSATAETRHLINARTLALMKPTALLDQHRARADRRRQGARRGARERPAGGGGPRRHRGRADRPRRSAAASPQLHRHAAHRRFLAVLPRGLPGAAGGERHPRSHRTRAARVGESRGDQDHRRDARDRSGPLAGRARLLDRARAVAGTSRPFALWRANGGRAASLPHTSDVATQDVLVMSSPDYLTYACFLPPIQTFDKVGCGLASDG